MILTSERHSIFSNSYRHKETTYGGVSMQQSIKCPPPWKEGVFRNARVPPYKGLGEDQHGCYVNINFCFIDTPGCFLYYVHSWEWVNDHCKHRWQEEQKKNNPDQPSDFERRIREAIISVPITFGYSQDMPFELYDLKESIGKGATAKFCRVTQGVCFKRINRSPFVGICKLTPCIIEYEVKKGHGGVGGGESLSEVSVTELYKGMPKSNLVEIGQLFGISVPFPPMPGRKKGSPAIKNPFECPPGCFLVCGD